MTTKAISRREFLEHLGILGGLGALYCGMTDFGSLEGPDQSLIYRGTSRGGYRQNPGAGLNAGILRPQFELKELLGSEFWGIGLFNDMYLYWQTSLMQPEDGMDKIPEAFLKHLGPNTRIQLNIRQSINLKVDWFWPATT
jgi:monoamine oxidase